MGKLRLKTLWLEFCERSRLWLASLVTSNYAKKTVCKVERAEVKLLKCLNSRRSVLYAVYQVYALLVKLTVEVKFATVSY